MSSNLSFSNVQPQSFNNSQGGLSFGTQQQNQDDKLFKGNLLENAKNDLQEIGAGITTIAGAILNTDPQARQQFISLFQHIKDDPSNAKILGDMILSTYNLTVDELGQMPFGDVVASIMSGAWQHPISALLDFWPVAASAGIKLDGKVASTIDKAGEQGVRIRAAEQVTKDNIRTANFSNEFLKEIDTIAKQYTPDTIGRGMQWIETRGIKTVPDELKPVVTDLLRANDSYKRLVASYGAEILDDVDMATAELIAKERGVPFSDIINDTEFKNSKMYQQARNYVVQNNVKPIFHLQPKTSVDLSHIDDLTTNVLERKFGTIDYDEAGKNIFKKAAKFVDALNTDKISKSAENVNKIIDDYNVANNTKIKKLDASGGVMNNKVLREINSELKKAMLGSGLYLAQNVMASTLSLLNNFDLGAFKRTLKDLPKLRLITLDEATTPVLNIISRINNRVSTPLASVDRWLENVASKYIEEYGIDKAKLMQSTVPTRVVSDNPVANFIKNLIPFSSYPIAAMGEIAENIRVRPERMLTYNQLPKVGSQVNQQVQEDIQQLREVEPTKVVRENNDNKLVQRSTVVTPIQAANMFILGEYGDAIQIPILTLINKLVRGEGDPNVFEVDGRTYRLDGTKIETSNGTFDLLPAIQYVGRQILSPVRFYNDVLVPLTTDKYIKDETKLFNRMVSDSQYSSMGTYAQRKVTTDATEKLGKRLVGTYEYNYFKPYVSRRAMKKVARERAIQQQIDRVLSDK